VYAALMSMNGTFRSVAPPVLEKLIEVPRLLGLVLTYSESSPSLPPLDEEQLGRLPPSFRVGLEASVQRMVNSTGATGAHRLAQSGLEPADLDERLSIDKAWMGVHRLLAGDDWQPTTPPANAVLGGVELGEDQGYGPARYLPAGDVNAIASALATLDVGVVAASFDAEGFERAQVYPGGWDQPDALGWLLGSLDELRAYYARASRLGRAMLLWVA
jgi:hypothetical protein